MSAIEKMDIDEMTDVDILQMLRDARTRLEAQGTVAVTSTSPQISGEGTRLTTGKSDVLATYIKMDKNKGARIDPKKLVSAKERSLANTPRIVQDPVLLKSKAEAEKKATAGAQWYNLPKTDLTPELKRDLQLLKMRSVLDPKRFYKKDNKRDAVPEFSHVGTIIEGPTEYYSARLSNKERKRTLVEEVLQGEKNTQKFKSKYRDIQAAKTSGKKAHYKAMSAKRKSKSRD